jgi:ATP-dependent Clp protease ATP-binding subunit ClpC
MQRNRLTVVQRNKPIASFLFLGPSGVGKTYSAKLLAKHYFGDEKALIRVDMSEFMEKYSVSKLLGSAP